jgi:predicted phage terminase large subunit-like protein
VTLRRAEALSPDELARVRAACELSPALFCTTFLGSWFRGPVSWFQCGILAILTRRVAWLEEHPEVAKIVAHFRVRLDPQDKDSATAPVFRWAADGHLELVLGRFTQLRIPRGFSKTTLRNAATLYKLCYKQARVILYTSETATHAETQLNNIRSELEGNLALRAVFGELRPDQRLGLKWNNDQIDCTNGTTVVARGSGAQVRGLLVRGFRPDDIVCDDVENREDVKSDELRKKLREWMYNDLMPALDELNPSATITVLGTLLHREALLKTLENDPRFTTIVFSARMPDGQLLWAAKVDEKKLELLKRSYVAAGMLASYYMEYMNELRVEEGAPFQERFIQHGLPYTGEELTYAIALDPAIGERKPGRKRPDFAAIVVAAISSRGRIFVVETWGRQGSTMREQCDQFFTLRSRYAGSGAAIRSGIEAQAFQRALVHLMREEMFRRHDYFELEAITHSAAKVDRINGILQPRYAAGVVWHQRRFPELESQLLDFPSGHDDFPDALAMAVALLDPFAAQAAPDDVNLAADEFKPIEEVLGEGLVAA